MMMMMMMMMMMTAFWHFVQFKGRRVAGHPPRKV
jgi:hypothetical protein